MALLLAGMAVQGYFRLRATTLGAPCLWAAVSGIALAAWALLSTSLEGIAHLATQFALAATTFCPLMAVLGAKRPQDRGWQWVVLSLWVVLVWPAAQAVLLPSGVRLELFIAWRLFLWGLIVLGLLNYLPTRHWRAAVLVAVGQVLLLREHLGLGQPPASPWPLLVSIGALVSAAWDVELSALKRPQPSSSATALQELTQRWLSFRDSFGAFWALRVLGRINQLLDQQHWPLELTWSGFAAQQEPTAEQLATLTQSLDSMLRRFEAEEEKS